MPSKSQSNLDRLKPRPLGEPLARLIRRQLKETGTPGVVVGVFRNGRAYAQGFGITNISAPAEVNNETLFQIGSTGKTFTASTAMRLVEQGKLDLDVPIRRYLKEELALKDADVAKRVTLRHLLTHTGGWAGDFFGDTGRGDDALAQIVARMKEIPQLTPLGEVFHYNNAGFYLVGRLIEKAYGKPYETAVKELLLDPLGMTRSFFFAEECIMHRVAVGHIGQGKKQTVAPAWWLRRGSSPAGGLVSDVTDQLRWAEFHLGDGRAPDGKRLLKKSTMKMMQEPQVPAGNLWDAVGISWLLEEANGVRIVSHGGTTVGQLSAFSMVPSKGLAVTSMTNSTSGRAINRNVVAWVLENYADIKRSAPEARRVSQDDVAPYGGRYIDAFKSTAIDVEPSGQRLVTKISSLEDNDSLPPFKLAIFDDDRAVQLEGDLKGMRIEFLRDGRNRVAWMRFGGRLYRRSPDGAKKPTRSKKTTKRSTKTKAKSRR